MMTFVNDDMLVVADKIVDLSLADEALDQSHIDYPLRLSLARPDYANGVAW